jgi:hypothetical protein
LSVMATPVREPVQVFSQAIHAEQALRRPIMRFLQRPPASAGRYPR